MDFSISDGDRDLRCALVMTRDASGAAIRVLQVLKQGRLSAKDQAEEVGAVVVKVEDAGFHRTDRTDIRLLTPPPSGPKGRTVFLISRGVSSCQGGPHRRDAVGAFETHLSSRS